VRAMVMAPNQSFLASASNDGTIRIWRAGPAPAVRPVLRKEKEKN